MSREVAKQIVQRTKKDKAFLQALLANPEEALKNYDLTDSERQFFKQADQKILDGLHDECFELIDKAPKGKKASKK